MVSVLLSFPFPDFFDLAKQLSTGDLKTRGLNSMQGPFSTLWTNDNNSLALETVSSKLGDEFWEFDLPKSFPSDSAVQHLPVTRLPDVHLHMNVIF